MANTQNMIKWIIDKYPEEEVLSLIDAQILEYVDYDSMESEGYDNEYEWYTDYGRGEAESDILTGLINEAKHELKIGELNIEEHCEVFDAIKDHFGI